MLQYSIGILIAVVLTAVSTRMHPLTTDCAAPYVVVQNITKHLEQAGLRVQENSDYLLVNASNSRVLQILGEHTIGYGAWIYHCERPDESVITVIPSRRNYIEWRIRANDYTPGICNMKEAYCHRYSAIGAYLVKATGIRLGFDENYLQSVQTRRVFHIANVPLPDVLIQNIVQCLPSIGWKMIFEFENTRRLQIVPGCTDDKCVVRDAIQYRNCMQVLGE